MEAERVACGSAHADNVAPSLIGGFVLIRGYSPLDVVSRVQTGVIDSSLHPRPTRWENRPAGRYDSSTNVKYSNGVMLV